MFSAEALQIQSRCSRNQLQCYLVIVYVSKWYLLFQHHGVLAYEQDVHQAEFLPFASCIIKLAAVVYIVCV